MNLIKALLSMSILCFHFQLITAQENMKIIYIGDPMCSWCYGIAPQWEKVYEHYKESAEIEIIMGGLRPYHKVPMTEMKDFLAEHWHQVNKATNQPFSYGILDNSSLVYDTEPPCRATAIVRELAPDKAIPFFKLIQEDFYSENKYLGSTDSYTESLKTLGIPVEDFAEAFESDKWKEQIKLDFQKSRSLEVSSFPTILVEKEGRISVVAKGYSESEEIIRRIEGL